MQSREHITKFIPGIIGILFIAHIVIPHQHHYNALSSHTTPVSEECPWNAQQTKDTDYHCHAFNNLVPDNYRDQLFQLIAENPVLASQSTESGLYPSEKAEAVIRIFSDRIKTEQYPYSTRPLRGPPIFS
jgi:hypothetical protein